MPLRDERNPFDPELAGPPLQFTFDGRSLSRLKGREAEEAHLLASLCETERIDGLVTWAEDGFAPKLPAALMRPGRGYEDSVAVALLGEGEGGSIGVIPQFGQWEQLAERLRLSGAERERLLHTGPPLAFHRGAGRHFFVCGDRSLLAARGRSPYTNIWRGVYSVREALTLAGAVLRPYGRLPEEVGQGGSTWVSNYTVRTELAVAALPNRRRLATWLAPQDQGEAQVAQMSALQSSLHLRATELLRAREGAEREEFRARQDNATADESLYHLRAAVAALAAACDSLATLAAIALEIPGDPLRVAFSQNEFRTALKSGAGASLDRSASEAAPMFALIKAFRDPIVHQAGPSGSTTHHLGAVSFSETRISDLSTEQVAAIVALGGAASKRARWGLREEVSGPSLSPLTFLGSLALRGMELIDTLLGALAADLGLPGLDGSVPIDPRRLQRMRLLSGMDPMYEDPA